jgi:hypothetical protein
MLTLPKDEYAAFYQTYIEELADLDKDIIQNLKYTYQNIFQVLKNLPESKQLFRYANDKWTIKEILQHLIDTERIFNYRALRFARRDATDLPGFEENDYVKNATANSRNYKEMLDEFSIIREGSIMLFKSFDKAALLRVGSANGSIMSVRAIGYVISGHLQHHFNVINERYL